MTRTRRSRRVRRLQTWEDLTYPHALCAPDLTLFLIDDSAPIFQAYLDCSGRQSQAAVYESKSSSMTVSRAGTAAGSAYVLAKNPAVDPIRSIYLMSRDLNRLITRSVGIRVIAGEVQYYLTCLAGPI